jgi:hypothetical protein
MKPQYAWWGALLTAAVLMAQPHRKPFQSQGSSTIAYGVKDSEETVEINNVSYQIHQRLALRKTTRWKQILGDKGADAKVTLEAWTLGDDMGQKPLYAITTDGTDVHTKGNALLVFDRGVEEVNWWSIYKLDDGRHLFDTYVPLLEFSITSEVQTPRYVGFEAPPDDASDARLNEPHVVGVLTYASGRKVIREALITCDNIRRAKELRSYWDQTRTLSLIAGKPAGSPPSIRISFSSNYPGKPPVTVSVTVGIAKDDLDLAHAEPAPGLRVAAWLR